MRGSITFSKAHALHTRVLNQTGFAQGRKPVVRA